MKRAALLIILILLTANLQAQSLDTLDASLTRIEQQRIVLIKDYDRLKKQNDDRRKRIEGGSAAEADIKQAYVSAASLDQINAKLNDLNTQTQQLCEQWRATYRSTIDSLLARAEKESDPKKKAEAGRNLQYLQ